MVVGEQLNQFHNCVDNKCKCKEDSSICSLKNWECGFSAVEDCSVNCGECETGWKCSEHKCECIPKDCNEMQWECGSGIENRCNTGSGIENRCNTLIECPSCPSGKNCENHQCFEPECINCCSIEWECGTCIDNCGNEINCGSCNDYHSCSLHKCICKPQQEICNLKKWNCGTGLVEDCNVDCGLCDNGFQCIDNECVPMPTPSIQPSPMPSLTPSISPSPSPSPQISPSLTPMPSPSPSPIEEDTVPPETPKNLKAEAGELEVFLSWNESTDNVGLNGYKIYRKVSTGEYTEFGFSSITEFEDTEVEAGTIYYYKVTAIDVAGNESGFSNSVGAKPVPKNKGPKITSLIAKPEGTIKEGEPVEFTVIAKDPENEEIEIEWHFGDGETIKAGKKISHTYYLEENEFVKTFNLTVVVTDESGNKEQKSIPVKVSKATLKVKLFEPKISPQEPFEKGKKYYLKVKILDEFNNPVPLNSIKKLNARIKGKKELLLQSLGSGIFGAELETSYDFDSIEYLEIEVEAEINSLISSTNAAIPLYFKPAELKVENPFKGTLFLNSKIGKIEVKPVLPNNAFPEKGEFYAELKSSFFSKKFQMTPKNEELFATIVHFVSEEDLDHGLKLLLRGQDSHGNILMQQFTIPLNDKNPFLHVEFVKPDFSTNKKYGLGEQIEVIARIFSPQGEKLKMGKISYLIEDTSTKGVFTQSEKEKEFKAKITMPLPEFGLKEVELKIYGEAEIGKNRYRDREVTTIPLTGLVNIEMLYPKNGFTEFNFEKPQTIYTKLTYPDGEPLTKNKINAVLFIDGKEKEIQLIRWHLKNQYWAKLDEPLEGKHDLSLKLLDGFTGTTTISTEIKKVYDWTPLFMVSLAVLFIAVIFFLWFQITSIPKEAENAEIGFAEFLKKLREKPKKPKKKEKRIEKRKKPKKPKSSLDEFILPKYR